MTENEFLCARCSRVRGGAGGSTCCQNTDIYLTADDIERVAAHCGRRDFVEYRQASNPDYLGDGSDPIWVTHAFREDGTKRVVRRRADGDCMFLTASGCAMPLETRPLICRIYPYEFDAFGVRESAAPGCPIELLAHGENLYDVLGMDVEAARRWHRMLYAEMIAEKAAAEAAGNDRPRRAA